ncbi:MAG TPA: polysaccharide deacetylase family protein [Devosia sp.]|jgi:peptidoglycan/xylan/chitin deacetylase (PgdA/CDA1 family)|uniref:polysaccharide deacetylase family protein n=1 Tax=Devosia sp. TaxID=1871048 RepID=UPI002F920082
MLTVKIPAGRPSERAYILDTLLGDFLGLPWRSETEQRSDVAIGLEGASGTLLMPDCFLNMPDGSWLSAASMPTTPLSKWEAGRHYPEARLVQASLPVIFGREITTSGADCIALPIDIFGSSFFMLSRYEEVARPAPDKHDRFPATASLAHAEGFLRRPIVNEYVELLWAAMQRLWPQLKRKVWHGTSFVTCDVDEPFLGSSRSFSMLARQAGGDILKRRNFEAAGRRLYGYLGARMGHDRWDPANSFDWMMDVNERAGNTMAFYLIADKTVPGIDGSAEIEDPFVIDLMSRIHARGHEIGLHGSYATYRNADQLRRELVLLRQAMDRAGVQQSDIGARQHFLRWRTPETARALDSIGLTYDTTLGYADAPGFRCGTCYSFRLYCLEKSEALTIRERPLIVMESSVISDIYLGLGYGGSSIELMRNIKSATMQFGGEFVLLWHNSHFMTNRDRQMYADIVGEL